MGDTPGSIVSIRVNRARMFEAVEESEPDVSGLIDLHRPTSVGGTDLTVHLLRRLRADVHREPTAALYPCTSALRPARNGWSLLAAASAPARLSQAHRDRLRASSEGPPTCVLRLARRCAAREAGRRPCCCAFGEMVETRSRIGSTCGITCQVEMTLASATGSLPALATARIR